MTAVTDILNEEMQRQELWTEEKMQAVNDNPAIWTSHLRFYHAGGRLGFPWLFWKIGCVWRSVTGSVSEALSMMRG